MSNGRIDGDKPGEGGKGGVVRGAVRCDPALPGASLRRRKEERTYARGICAARRVERVAADRESHRARETENGRRDPRAREKE